ncbi:MAG: hypothetical protein EA353_06340 [Puniceicoccaceae bacterium]|nr:MAG: hypothetical protein EA353_06340 [Puniceicoccaceae bacterium]
MNTEDKRSKAWIGDAVLALYARQWILQQPDIRVKDRAEVFIQMTSNQFLASLGEPTAVEAEIGLAYQKGGLQVAFQHIESTIMPLFQKQRIKSKQPGNYRAKRGD